MRGAAIGVLVALAMAPLGLFLVVRGSIPLLAKAPAVTKGWSWTRGPDSTVARTEVAAALTFGGIYVIGGFVEPNRTTAIVERYDLKTRKWSRVAPLPEPRNHAAAIGYRGRVYVVGGYASPDGLAQPSRKVFRYNPRVDRWEQLRSMPTARGALGLAVVHNRLYAVGGSDGRRPLRTVEAYDVETGHWTDAPAMKVPREHLGVVGFGRAVYAIGGRNADGNLALVERLRPDTGHWVRLPDLDRARGGNGAAVGHAPARIFAVGGEEPEGTIGEVELFDPRRPRHDWRRLPEMPNPRHGLGVVADDRTERVYTIEGGTSPGFSFSKHLEILIPRP